MNYPEYNYVPYSPMFYQATNQAPYPMPIPRPYDEYGSMMNDENMYTNVNENTDMDNMDMSNTDMSNADMSNADMSNADMSNADMSNVDMDNERQPHNPGPGHQIIPGHGQHGQPPGHGQQGQYQRPPSYVPRRPYGHNDLDSLRHCLYRLGYMWLYNGNNFWVRLSSVDRRAVRGHRWNGRMWVYFEITQREIATFACI